MSAKHTPGRWWVSGADDDEVHCRIFAQDMGQNVHISLVKPPHVGGIIPAEQLKANARLIAAAPELLEALKELADLYDTDEGCRSLPEYIAARAAIAKAIG